MFKKKSIIIIVIGLAVFLFTNSALSKRERLGDCLPDNTLNSAFFIGEDMRLCNIEGCNRKYKAKGLCAYHYNKIYRTKYNKQYNQTYRKHKKQYQKYYNKQWREDNKEHIIEYKKANKERRYKQGKQWRLVNKERITKYRKQYSQTLMGKLVYRVGSHNRRVLKKDLTKDTIWKVYEANIKKFGTLTCVLCNKPIEFNKDSLEHLTPLTRGGSNNYDNLGIAHRNCNSKKHTMTLKEWFKKEEVPF